LTTLSNTAGLAQTIKPLYGIVRFQDAVSLQALL